MNYAFILLLVFLSSCGRENTPYVVKDFVPSLNVENVEGDTSHIFSERLKLGKFKAGESFSLNIKGVVKQEVTRTKREMGKFCYLVACQDCLIRFLEVATSPEEKINWERDWKDIQLKIRIDKKEFFLWQLPGQSFFKEKGERLIWEYQIGSFHKKEVEVELFYAKNESLPFIELNLKVPTATCKAKYELAETKYIKNGNAFAKKHRLQRREIYSLRFKRL